MPGHHNWLNQTEIEMNSSLVSGAVCGKAERNVPSACGPRLVRKLKGQYSTAKPEQTWTKVYPKAIPDYASLPNEARWNEQRRLTKGIRSANLADGHAY